MLFVPLQASQLPYRPLAALVISDRYSRRIYPDTREQCILTDRRPADRAPAYLFPTPVPLAGNLGLVFITRLVAFEAAWRVKMASNTSRSPLVCVGLLNQSGWDSEPRAH